MNLEVTSVSKQSEKLSESPSAIQVVTDDDIQLSGAASIPEALRLADNLEVAQKDANNWAISARGFDANLADKLLVLIDGRTVYSPLYAGVIWNVQDTVLEDVDRIEVISGPGGTVWGANAVNGIINLTTKSAKDTQGLYLNETVGDQLQDQSSVRYGGSAGPNTYYRVYVQHSEDGSEDFSNGARASDGLRTNQAGFRIDSEASPGNLLTLQGDAYTDTQDLGAAGEGSMSGGNVLGRMTHTFADGSDLVLQAYYDRTNLAQPAPASPASPPYMAGFPAASLHDNLDTYDVDLQRRFQIGESNRFVMGTGYRLTHESDVDLNIVRFEPATQTLQLANVFIQDEIALAPRVHLTVGSKVEHNDYTGFEYEPSGRLSWTPTPKQLVWAAVSRAVRTPSRYDRDLEVVTGLQNAPAPYVFPVDFLEGSKDFKSETELAYELGYRAELGPLVSVSVSGFYNVYNNLRSTSATPVTALYPFPYPVYFQNNLEGHTQGVELTANYQVLAWWRLHAGYDLLRENIHVKPGQVDTTNGLNETADPHNQAFVRSAMDLPAHLQFGASFRWIDSLTLDSSPTGGPVAGTVPSYAELDLRLGWQASKHLELSLVGQNLLHRYHVEYGFPGSAQEAIPRGVYGKAELRY